MKKKKMLFVYNPRAGKERIRSNLLDIIDTFVYRLGLEQAQFSVSTAVGLFKSVISIIMVSLSNYLAGRFANYRVF